MKRTLPVLFFFLGASTALAAIQVRPHGWSDDPRPLIVGELDKVYPRIGIRLVRDGMDVVLSDEQIAVETKYILYQIPVDLSTGLYTAYLQHEGEVVAEVELRVDRTPPTVPKIKKAVQHKKTLSITCEAEDEGSGTASFELLIWVEGAQTRTLTNETCHFLVPIEWATSYLYRVRAVDQVGLMSQTEPHKFESAEKPKPKKIDLVESLPVPEGFDYSFNWTMQYRSVRGQPAQHVPKDFEQTMIARISGEVEGVKVQGDFQELPRQPSRNLIEVSKSGVSGKLGNFSSGTQGSQFLNFAKDSKGFEVTSKQANHELKVFTFEAQSFTQTKQFSGDGTRGPYTVVFNMVPGSETVIVDDGTGKTTTYQRDAAGPEGYVIDYFEGKIIFNQVLPSTYRVTVTYEFSVADFFLRSGDVSGLQGKWQISPSHEVSVIGLNETAAGAAAFTTATEEETFDSLTDPIEITKEYPLSRWPLVQNSEVVTVIGRGEQPIFSTSGSAGGYAVDYRRGTVWFLQSNYPPPGHTGTTEQIQAVYAYQVAFAEAARLTVEIGEGKCSKDASTITCPLPLTIPRDDPSVAVRVWRNADLAKDASNLLTPRGNEPTNNVGYPTQHAHYELDLSTQQIRFFLESGVTEGSQVLIEKRTAPRAEEQEDLKKQALSFAHAWKIGRKTELRYEIAQGTGDRQKLGEELQDAQCYQVTADPATTPPECPLPIELSGGSARPFILRPPGVTGDFIPIVPGTEKLVLRQAAGGDPRQLNRTLEGRPGDYRIDYNTGEVIPSVALAEGDQIEATYDFFPPGEPLGASLDKITGTAVNVDLSTQVGKMGFRGTYRRVQPRFVPVGSARPVPEDGFFQGQINFDVSRILSLNAGYSQSQVPEFDFNKFTEGEKVTRNRSFQGGLTLQPPHFPVVNFSFQKTRADDNLEQKETDNRTTSTTLTVTHPFKLGSVETTNKLIHRRAETKTLVAGVSGQIDEGLDFDTQIKPSPKLDLRGNVQHRTLHKIGADEQKTLQSKTLAWSVNTNYVLSRTARLNANILKQQVEQPQETSAGASSDTLNMRADLTISEISLHHIPFRQAPLYARNFSLFWEADTISGGETQSVRAATRLELTRKWGYNVSFAENRTRRDNPQQTTTSTTHRHDLSYTDLGRWKFSAVAGYGQTKSKQVLVQEGEVVRPDPTGSRQLFLQISHFWPKELSWRWSVNQNKAGIANEVTTSTLDLVYSMKKQRTLSGKLLHEEQRGTTSNTRQDHSLILSFPISEQALFSLDLRYVDDDRSRANTSFGVRAEVRI